MKDRDVGLTIALVVIVAVASISIPMIAMGFAHGFRGWHMGRGIMGYGWGMVGSGWISSLLVLTLVALMAFGAYLLFSSKSEKGSVALPGVKAVEILKDRYAKGEITREEYLRMKEEVQK